MIRHFANLEEANAWLAANPKWTPYALCPGPNTGSYTVLLTDANLFDYLSLKAADGLLRTNTNGPFPPKRPRGRPRTVDVNSPLADPLNTDFMDIVAPKRKRGRPRKVPLA